jgi:hypothetical protein
MEDLRLVGAPADYVAFSDHLVHIHTLRSFPSEPNRLLFQHAVQIQVTGVNEDGSTGRVMHTAQSDDVIDMRVRDHDGLHFQPIPLDYLQNSFCIVARVDDDCFACAWISQDVAIALQHANGQDFMDEFLRFRHGD